MSFALIFLAAGKGHRFGEKKQFHRFHDTPLYQYSLRTFLKHPDIKEIVIVSHPEDKPRFEAETEEGGERISLIDGGKERYLSVQKGLEALSHKKQEYLLIHDAARPLISFRDIQGIIKKASLSKKGVLPCQLVKDTIKQIEDDRVKESLPRNNLAAATTPQCFPMDRFLHAYAPHHLREWEIIPTDDAEIYFKAGEEILIYWLRDPNPKLTTPEDIPLIEGLLKSRLTENRKTLSV